MIASEPTRLAALPLSRPARRFIIVGTLLLGDTLVLLAAFALSYLVRFVWLPHNAPITLPVYTRILLVTVPAWLLLFAAFRLYDRYTLFGGLQEYAALFNAVTVGAVALMIVFFFRREDLLVSRGWLALAWFLALLFLLPWRFAFRRFIYSLRRRGHFLAPALVVGANAEGRALAEQLRDWSSSGLYLTGFVDPGLPANAPVPLAAPAGAGGPSASPAVYRVLGGLSDLPRLVRERQVEEVIVAPTALTREQLLAVFADLTPHPDLQLRLSSGLFELLTTGLRVKELAFVPLIEVNKTRITGLDAFLKGALDLLGAAFGLLVLAPLFLVLAVAIRLDSPGPAFYRRRVMGANNTQFDAFKFRTMRCDGDALLAARPDLRRELARSHKLKDDPRITRLGRFLRKTSLDELPQLANVLLGQMSLVGPRMISPPEMAEYGAWGLNLLTVKPGLTGLWQVSGRSDVSYAERVRLDMYYIRNWTLWLDLYLLLATLPAVLRKKGAY